jgi:two-component system, chemotaxis family, chemotaxis protein CheV
MSAEQNILLKTGTNELEIIEFILHYTDKNGEQIVQSYGINVSKVREITRMPNLTVLPSLPKCVYGVFNLRDQIIPALDLSMYLYKEENTKPNKKMIIAEFNRIRCGFIVSDVKRIHRISWEQISSPDTLEGLDSEDNTIIGIIKFDDRNILMVDIEKIVAEIDPKSALDPSNKKISIQGKPKAITVEDSSTIRKMITDRLVNAGFEIIPFNNGKDAWDALSNISSKVASGSQLNEFVDVVVTDIEMPKMDGYSLTKHIKSNDILQKLPVVIFSSIVSEDVFHKGKSVGADAQLTKPQIGDLIETIDQLLQ